MAWSATNCFPLFYRGRRKCRGGRQDRCRTFTHTDDPAGHVSVCRECLGVFRETPVQRGKGMASRAETIRDKRRLYCSTCMNSSYFLVALRQKGLVYLRDSGRDLFCSQCRQVHSPCAVPSSLKWRRSSGRLYRGVARVEGLGVSSVYVCSFDGWK